MKDFFDILLDPEISFLRYAFTAGLLAAPAFGVIGSYVVVKRISYVAGAVAHSVLAGIGAALFFSARFGTGLQPMAGALVSALLAALIIGTVSIRAKQREDTVIGAIWAVGMAAGLLFIAGTPGYVDPMSYLFGNILLISKADIWLVVVMDAVVLGISILFYNKLMAVCFDPEFTALRGVNVNTYYLVLLCLASLTIVLLVRIVGIVMVIALLTLPAATAGIFFRKLWSMMVASTLLCMFLTGTGIALSFAWNLPSGPVIIVLAGIVYILAICLSRAVKISRSAGCGRSTLPSGDMQT